LPKIADLPRALPRARPRGKPRAVLTVARNERELRENIVAAQQGLLAEDDMIFMRAFGDAVHAQKKWFM